MAELLIEELPEEACFVLGDTRFNTPEVRTAAPRARVLGDQWTGTLPAHRSWVEVRRTFHRLRNVAIENFNEHFEAVFGAYEPVPTKGEANTARFASGAVFVYQLAPLYRYEHDLGANVGLEAFLEAA